MFACMSSLMHACENHVLEVEALPPLLTVFLTPEQVLRAVAEGIDLFQGDYPLRQAFQGFALVFDFSFPGSGRVSACPPKLNLRDRSFVTDLTSLVVGCTCPTCRRHTRAYLHHLWQTQEMNSELLLITHNLVCQRAGGGSL